MDKRFLESKLILKRDARIIIKNSIVLPLNFIAAISISLVTNAMHIVDVVSHNHGHKIPLIKKPFCAAVVDMN
ncbi:hypothetical protein [Sporosarcina aquimarina]|uniref:hypothetical protein n=1 Tax=Sporosarcina aquimarina TaxID=114975 RepID=UPI003D819511